LEAIRKAYPDSRVPYIVGKSAAEVLDDSPLINELILWPDAGRDRRADLKMIRKIARMRFDIAFSLSQSPKVNFALRATRAPIRVGFTPVAQSWLLTHRIAIQELPRDLHRTQYFLEAARRLGLKIPDPVRMHYQVTQAEREEAQMILQRWNIDPATHRLVAIHPGTSPLYVDKRRWPTERFAAVARHLAGRPGCKTLIMGGSAERGMIEHFAGIGSPHVVDLTSTLSFREFAAVLSLCHLLLHNDSAPLHLAGALGVPVLSIFGYQNHHVWGPIGAADRVVRRDLPCSPCPSEFVCDRSFECLRGLETADVIAVLQEMLEQRSETCSGERVQARPVRGDTA
jgi:ADP-heptose:LPS heptosyltransferase